MENMKKYGKTLMSQEPDKTTDLLKLLCTEYKPKDGENNQDFFFFFDKFSRRP